VRVPHDGEYYYWNTTTDEVKWEHPGGKAVKPEKPVFKEEHKILWSDIGKIIGKQGINLKIIKASIGCDIKVPRQKGKGKGGKDEKGKGKGKEKAKVIRGRGDGTTQFSDDEFANVIIEADSSYKARGGKRTLEVMLGYGRPVERALTELGVDVVMPTLSELDQKLGKAAAQEKDGVDPMDPASYSDAPLGGWSAGMKKVGADGKVQKRSGPSEPMDSKTANAERC
jgi:hypothetical protein